MANDKQDERWPICEKCGETDAVPWIDGHCINCWPGYNLCANPKCEDYRCEHTDEGCHCGHCDGFVEGSEKRIVTNKEFEALKKSWGM